MFIHHNVSVGVIEAWLVSGNQILIRSILKLILFKLIDFSWPICLSTVSNLHLTSDLVSLAYEFWLYFDLAESCSMFLLRWWRYNYLFLFCFLLRTWLLFQLRSRKFWFLCWWSSFDRVSLVTFPFVGGNALSDEAAFNLQFHWLLPYWRWLNVLCFFVNNLLCQLKLLFLRSFIVLKDFCFWLNLFLCLCYSLYLSMNSFNFFLWVHNLHWLWLSLFKLLLEVLFNFAI